jgi:hypothetical protein
MVLVSICAAFSPRFPRFFLICAALFFSLNSLSRPFSRTEVCRFDTKEGFLKRL